MAHASRHRCTRRFAWCLPSTERSTRSDALRHTSLDSRNLELEKARSPAAGRGSLCGAARWPATRLVTVLSELLICIARTRQSMDAGSFADVPLECFVAEWARGWPWPTQGAFSPSLPSPPFCAHPVLRLTGTSSPPPLMCTGHSVQGGHTGSKRDRKRHDASPGGFVLFTSTMCGVSADGSAAAPEHTTIACISRRTPPDARGEEAG